MLLNSAGEFEYCVENNIIENSVQNTTIRLLL